MNEVWKDIVGYEGHYQVSNLGRVKSIKFGKEKILKQAFDKDGYLQSVLSKNNKHITFLTHRLVAKAFIDNPNNYCEINHKDENKQNNCVDNLEWCDRQYNNDYSLSKQVFQYDKDLNLICIWKSNRNCETKGFKHQNVNACCNGKIKSYKGFIWSYNELKPQAV